MQKQKAKMLYGMAINKLTEEQKKISSLMIWNSKNIVGKRFEKSMLKVFCSIIRTNISMQMAMVKKLIF